MGTIAKCLALVCVSLIVAGCARTDLNKPYSRSGHDPSYGYRLNQLEPTDGGDVFVILALSGGGMRAAAVSYGVLEELNKVRYDIGDGPRVLLDEVDIITAVSGGSAVAGYYGLLDRIDVLSDIFERRLFGEATFARLLEKKSRPLIMLNAADISTGAVFYFTQDQFDAICSDLSSFSLAKAVAASAAFPVFLSPIMLRNYSGKDCPVENGIPVPDWIGLATDYNPPDTYGDRYNVPSRFRRALLEEELRKVEDAYRKPEYVHLFDGGLADNLGLRAPLVMLGTTDPASALLDKISAGEIKKVAIIVVNARKHPDNELDRRGSPAGAFSMLHAVTHNPLDIVTSDTQDKLWSFFGEFRGELKLIRDYPLTFCFDFQRNFCGGAKEPDFCKELAKPNNFEAACKNVEENLFVVQNAEKYRDFKLYRIEVDFDLLEDQPLRRRLKNIETKWSLSDEEVDLLKGAGASLLRQAPQFDCLRKDLGIISEVPKSARCK
jgi:NTE family protein